MNDLWTIEVNLDDDFASSCAWHIDTLDTRLKDNFVNLLCSIDGIKQHNGIKQDNWVLIHIANSYNDAHDYVDSVRNLLCEKYNKKPKNLNWLE